MSNHKTPKLLDVTLREIVNFEPNQFEKTQIKALLLKLAQTGIEYIELDKQFYSRYSMAMLRRLARKAKLSVMIDAADIPVLELKQFKLSGVQLIRIRYNKNNQQNIKIFINQCQLLNIETALCVNGDNNTTEASKNMLKSINELSVDYLFIDLDGTNQEPNTVNQNLKTNSKRYGIAMGYQAYNRSELSKASAITAINAGAQLLETTLLPQKKDTLYLDPTYLATYLNALKANDTYNIEAMQETSQYIQSL